MDASSEGGVSSPSRLPGRGRGRGGARSSRQGGRGVEPMSTDSVRKPSGRGRGRGGRKSSSDHVSGARHKISQKDPADSGVTDEDVMIEFMYFLRSGDEEARNIHATCSGKRKLFVQAVRDFLNQRKNGAEPNNCNNIFTDDSPTDTGTAEDQTPTHSELSLLNSSTFRKSHSALPKQEQALNHTDVYQFSSTPSFQPLMEISEIRTVEDLFRLNRYDDKFQEMDTFTMPLGGDGDPDLIRMVDTLTMQGFDEYDAHDMEDVAHISTDKNVASSTSIEEVPPNPKEAEPTMPETPEKTTNTDEKPTATPNNIKWQPRRQFMRIHEQPGQLLANNVAATEDGLPYIILGPRRKIIATWKLPLTFLRQYALKILQEKDKDGLIDTSKLTLQDAIQKLTVGLFRRGCAENGDEFSIISKTVLVPENSELSESEKAEFQVDIDSREDLIWGTVPFYTPRTPGNVVLRLYFEDHTLDTLATSRCIRVTISEHDLEATLRFILSNFKTNKGSNLSPLYSFAAVIEQFTPSADYRNGKLVKGRGHSAAATDGIFESAGRAAFGCLCEARRAFEACRYEFKKKKSYIQQPQEKVKGNSRDEDSVNDQNEDEVEGSKETRKQDLFKSRKWTEMQSTFASVLRALLGNPALSLLLKRDTIQKIRLEYELWCGFCESFADNPWVDGNEFDDIADSKGIFRCPHPVTEDHFNMGRKNVAEMQTKLLGFVPSRFSLARRNMKAFEELSKFLKDWYIQDYAMSVDAQQQREKARSRTEEILSQCTAFPKGTKVVVFGSSANGFGSRGSDLDMCIQMPQGSQLLDGQDTNGAVAMAQVAKLLEEAGMENVDVARLTARIPLIMFQVSYENSAGQKLYFDCDLSMQNPLACVNTSLLLSYSYTHPDIRVLAAIIKVWAKNRDINNPSNHTLSSYGYILMLLYFLTTNQWTDDGTVASLFTCYHGANKGNPIVPNLQWVDPAYVSSPGSPYQELKNKPSNNFVMKHPMEPTYSINTYYLNLNSDSARKKAHETSLLVPKDSLALLLASFFRFYAYEFDYKKHVVSLNATLAKGPLERESKCESDGWKIYGETLFIEDPFECFYDVAHVLKVSTFRIIRKEFALAYSKVIEWNRKYSDSVPTDNDFLNILFDPISRSEPTKDESD